MLQNGHILLIDNGQYARNRPAVSVVTEIDPATNKVVWTYPEHPLSFTSFFSSIIGGAQRLPNGKTPITLGVPGRLMEVTPGHDVVWDYYLPDGQHVFKARSYLPALLPQ